ncbi:putative bifunctional diguanylate cyclase/phosphodiesterase [Chelativorans sp. YIM 93263]|uniref:putative bifunctional diguanylate cyclase/phosphodiesterase n=1 Tax=Chelativorans sp. YIM 93263 TaxID=2906648 RepID=UPI0023781952|nr:EAL domain-containing protein [Chelativorans sp. YIM 93263]
MANHDSDVPKDVYVQFVRSLFESKNILLVGALCHAVVPLMAYVRTQRPIFAILSVALLGIGIWRYLWVRSSQAQLDLLNDTSARKWENNYIFKGAVQGFFLGTFGFVSIYLYPDQFVELGAAAVNLGSLITVVGRNYGSSRMVFVFSTTLLAPIALALILRGDLAHVFLGILTIPFIFVIMRSADEVRKILARAVTERRNADQLAQRFDRALNTMSQGLVMFGPAGRVVVANAQAAQALGFQNSEQPLGRTLKSLLMRGVAGGLLSSKDFRYAQAQLTRALSKGQGKRVLLRLTDGRHLEFSAREGKDELAVVTFDDVTQRVEAEEKIRHMARYDSLTNLPNRAHFQEMVKDLMAAGDQNRLCGLAVVDLDDFKSVNDTLGHPVGDGLIYAVAERLAEFESDNVKVSRFGGDEFTVFFNRVEDERDFYVQFDEIFSRLRGSVDIAGHMLPTQASGGAVVTPARDSDVDAMMVKSDLALYRAKEQGKNGWRLFEAEMDQAFRDRQTLKSDLRSAIRANSLRVVYQPIVDIKSMRISGCEALCRWNHPELGAISPSVFIPLAEEMGIVSEISTIVLEAACRECVRWPEHLGVSVNLSAKDFYNGSVVDKVREALSNAGLAPHRLEIEVTETALLDDRTSTSQYIEELKKVGVRIALDDFGTGYSSLSYLHTLPLDRVKIDGSFLRDIAGDARSRQLLIGIINLSRNLGLAVTVEGVETFEQLRFLRESTKPDRVQGFLFGSALTSTGIKTISDMEWSTDERFVGTG